MKKEILKKRLNKLQKNFEVLREYKNFIEKLADIYTPYVFNSLKLEQKAILEAYLKRFAFVQDYLGAKVFKLLLENKGIIVNKMSEVLIEIEREDIIDLEKWIELRSVRNELEHDYPDELEVALEDLKYCVENFYELEKIIKKVFEFAKD
jgi:phage major head subunit gpT-like protein